MSALVTPARRRRDSEDASDESPGPSSAPGAQMRLNSSKRRRTIQDEDDDSTDVASETQDGPLLPDSYLRSPQGRRTFDAIAGERDRSSKTQAHQPGSIVRVTLTDFVTYTNAEFHPGPNLNMVIGPNGTGKSTLVCAICLGLGWNTSHLGRAKDIGEFVKHGATRAKIEIELAADPNRHRENPVISTRITRDNKTTFALNGSLSNKKAVQELMRSFCIQVDNLCQFLPQDRVVEFAALSSIDLLVHTQRAAAPDYMTEWHEELKLKRKEEKQAQEQQSLLADTISNLETRQRAQEGEVTRLRERSGLQIRAATLEKLKPFAQYRGAQKIYNEAKTNKKKAIRALRLLERQVEPNMRIMNNKKDYLDKLENVGKSRTRIFERLESDAKVKLDKFEGSKNLLQAKTKDIDAEANSLRDVRKNISRQRLEVSRLEKEKESPPPDYDFPSMNEEIREKKNQIREIETEHREVDERVTSLQEQVRQRQVIINQASREKENLQSESGRQANKLEKVSRDTSMAWKWVQENRSRFQSDVFGPAMIECTVKDSSHVDAVESVIARSELTAITVTSQADFRLLSEQFYRQMKLKDINLRSSLQPLSTFRPPCSPDQMQELGLEAWILNLLEGPEPVLAMLCDNRNIHQTGFISREISNAQYISLSRSPVSSWVTLNQIYIINRRREYGEAATSTRVNPLRKAQFLTDTPVDHHAEQEITRRIAETKDEVMQLVQEGKELQARMTDLNEKKGELLSVQRKLEEAKDQKQRQVSNFNGLDTKIENAQRRLANEQEKIEASRLRVMSMQDEIDKICFEKAQQAIDFARSLEIVRDHMKQVLEVEIMSIEAKSDLENLTVQNETEKRMLDDKKREVNELTTSCTELFNRAKALEEQGKELGANLTEDEQVVYQETEDWTSERLETEIQSVLAQLDMLHGGNENVIADFEQRATKIEDKRQRLREVESSLETLSSAIKSVRDKWEPELDALIQRISEAFSENFSRIQCAGEVSIHKDEDFENWAIQIKVKFRQTEQLSVLDSHRQSGGERAVSTIFYLMALQSLARAPFRVVDEINQGMDPRNERLVHSRMVDIACAEHTSQYFLITPKLLSGLKYHANMKVHCIASGERMPEDYRELDFHALARKALAMRAGSSAAASG